MEPFQSKFLIHLWFFFRYMTACNILAFELIFTIVYFFPFSPGDREPPIHQDVSVGIYSSEEEYVGSSEDDEDFIVPAKYVRITTLAEILAHRIQLPVSSSSEEVKLDPRLVSEHLVSVVTYTGFGEICIFIILICSTWGQIWNLLHNLLLL